MSLACSIRLAFVLCSCSLIGVQITSAADELPRSLDPRVEIVRFADSSQIVHPVSLDFDRQGRLLVIESHTHFRPPQYQGPAHDRIRMVEDTDGDGRADRFTTFFEGTKATMDLAVHRDGSVYIATRNEILRLRDTNHDGVADEQQRIVFLDTPGNYPHNGLSGLAFDADGNLFFGMGENLGAAYKLVGSDGSTHSDEGEGGNVFWCTSDGQKLRRIATGFWNPFGLQLDPFGRLWCVDNDPDAAPPCRLLHVIEGGDYGYQFRYGRSGRHVFQAWNGQLPGTLPMVSGTGEAPCEVLNYQGVNLPGEYRGELLVTSWADHRVERYTLRARGASFVADRKPFIQGGNDFRPVGLATAPDGSLMISDWVRRDYNLHGQGGLWRIRRRADIAADVLVHAQPVETPTPTAPYQELQSIVAGEVKATVLKTAREQLNHDDPFIRAAVGHQLQRDRKLLDALLSEKLLTSRQRRELLLAQRAIQPLDANSAKKWLGDSDEQVRFLAVKWISDLKLLDAREPIAKALEASDLNIRLYQAYATALSRLDGQEVSDQKMADHFVKLLKDDSVPSARRIAALRLVPSAHKQLTLDVLAKLTTSPDVALQLEAVRSLGEIAHEKRFELLRQIAVDAERDESVRAAAVVGLSEQTPPPIDMLIEIAQGKSAGVRDEALRALAFTPLSAAQVERLKPLASAGGSAAALVARVSGEPAPTRPALTDTAAWLKRLEGSADPAAGQRVFFHAKLAACYRCHRVEGHGRDVGPDLSMISRTERRHVLESILQPSTLVAPHYQVWQMALSDGRTLTGMLLRTNLDEYTYLDPQGNTFTVRTIDIAETLAAPLSIMPHGLIDKLTDQELRDLLAYLGSLK